MSKKITVTMTQAEMWAVIRFAECAANAWDDALAVIPNPQKAMAGFRGIDKLREAYFGAPNSPKGSVQ